MQHEMNREFDEFFHDDFSATESLPNRNWLPAINIEEANDVHFLKAELSGMRRTNFKITLDNNVLTIRGEKKVENEGKRGNYHCIERSSGVFERFIVLPGSVSLHAIDALYTGSMLPVIVPKKDEAKPIEVKVK